jgi:hypothetical protein
VLPGHNDYLYETPVHLPDGTEKHFGDLTRMEMHELMDAAQRGDPQAVFDVALLRLRAFALSVKRGCSAGCSS